MRLTILGAGPVGLASAALAGARGHGVTLWSPRGGGTRGIRDAVLAEGQVAGRFPVLVAADLGRALADAEVVLLAVPGHAQGQVMRRIAAVVQGAPTILVAPATSLSPLLLDRLLVARGIRAPIGALATPPMAARRLGADRVWVGALRRTLWLGAVPAQATARLVPLVEALFGLPTEPLADALAAALADLMPLMHAAQALAPALGPAGQADPAALARLLSALTTERDALAAAFGHQLPDADRFMAEIGGLPPAEPERALAEAPHALSFLLALGRAARVAMPVAEATLTLLEVLSGRTLRGNAILAELDPKTLARQLQMGAAA
jgi:opine dehydrogenase